jgi:hypothetical protein
MGKGFLAAIGVSHLLIGCFLASYCSSYLPPQSPWDFTKALVALILSYYFLHFGIATTFAYKVGSSGMPEHAKDSAETFARKENDHQIVHSMKMRRLCLEPLMHCWCLETRVSIIRSRIEEGRATIHREGTPGVQCLSVEINPKGPRSRPIMVAMHRKPMLSAPDTSRSMWLW